MTFLKKLFKKQFIHISLDDIHELNITLGVLTALVLALLGNLFPEKEDYQAYGFRRLMGYETFRNFVIETMDIQDIGTYKPVQFNYTFQIKGRILNLKEVLKKPGDYGREWNFDEELQVALELIGPVFPMDKMDAWSSLQEPGSDLHHPWRIIYQYGWWSCCFIGAALVLSTLCFIFMALSSARGSQEAARIWTRHGFKLCMFGYFFFSMGLVLCMNCFNALHMARVPNGTVGSAEIRGPAFCGALIIAITAVYCTILYVIGERATNNITIIGKDETCDDYTTMVKNKVQTAADIATRLKEKGMTEFADVFVEQDINASRIPLLMADSNLLNELGATSLGQKLKLRQVLLEIQNLTAQDPTPPTLGYTRSIGPG